MCTLQKHTKKKIEAGGISPFGSEVPDPIVPEDIFPDPAVDDMWRDAKMNRVLAYLHVGIGCQLPQVWHDFIPPKL